MYLYENSYDSDLAKTVVSGRASAVYGLATTFTQIRGFFCLYGAELHCLFESVYTSAGKHYDTILSIYLTEKL